MPVASSTTKTNGPIMIHSLTGLRFYAALIVFFSHLYLFNYVIGLTDGPLNTWLREMGWVGVSIFFVLSGFVLFLRYADPKKNKEGRFDLKGFYLARFARIYPLFILTTLCAAPLQWLSHNKGDFWQPLGLNASMTQCFEPHACSTFNGVGWSLSHEAFFYLVFPALFWLGRRRPFYSFGMIFIGYLAYLLLLVLLAPHEYAAQATFPINRLGEFLVGMGLGAAYIKLMSPSQVQTSDRESNQQSTPLIQHPKLQAFLNAVPTEFLIITLIAAMSLFSVIFSANSLRHQLYYIWLIPPASLIILLLALKEGMGKPSPFFVHRWVLLGGEISYAFYLVHHLLMRYSLHIARYVFHIDLRYVVGKGGILLIGIEFALASIIAYALHRWFENPARAFILRLREAPCRLRI